jgi:hypothetical protein
MDSAKARHTGSRNANSEYGWVGAGATVWGDRDAILTHNSIQVRNILYYHA